MTTKEYKTVIWHLDEDPSAIGFDSLISDWVAKGAELIGGISIGQTLDGPAWLQAMLIPVDVEPTRAATDTETRSATDAQLIELFAELRADLFPWWKDIALAEQMELARARINEFSARVLAGEIDTAEAYAAQVDHFIKEYPGRPDTKKDGAK